MLEHNKLYLMDCMEGMSKFPDKHFSLAIVDPPYGITGAFTESSRIAKYGQTYTANDLKPGPDYFDELFRVSQHQIIDVRFTQEARNAGKNAIQNMR